MLARRTGWDDRTLHVHAGLAIWFCGVVAAGGHPGSPWPVVLVVAVESANEIGDRLRKGAWLWRETIADFFHTVSWPLVIWILSHG
jgi:hypothetical protein